MVRADSAPLLQSQRILVSTIGRMAVGQDGQARTEPVAGTITLTSMVRNLRFVPLRNDGSKMDPINLEGRGAGF